MTLPAEDKTAHAVYQKFGVRVQLDSRSRWYRAECLDSGEQFHFRNVGQGKAPDISRRFFPSITTAPQPPGPGLPMADPSVKMRMILSKLNLLPRSNQGSIRQPASNNLTEGCPPASGRSPQHRIHEDRSERQVSAARCHACRATRSKVQTLCLRLRLG
jgi:hypothetical protein